MIVVVAQFDTDGDFHVDAEEAGLVHEPDTYDYCGTFLCADVEEAQEVLERIFISIDAKGYLFQWFVRTFGDAFDILSPGHCGDELCLGWCKYMSGNYGATHLFMQEVAGR